MSIVQLHLQERAHTFCLWRVEGSPDGEWGFRILVLVVRKAGIRVEKGVTKRDSVELVSIDYIPCVSVTVPVLLATQIAGGTRVRALQVHSVVSIGHSFHALYAVSLCRSQTGSDICEALGHLGL